MKLFLSYKWEDKVQVDSLKGTLLNPNNKYRHTPKTERINLKGQGEKVIKNHLKEILGECEALICLIGNNTHESNWVSYELEVANSQEKKIVPVRIKGTNGKTPSLLKKWNIKIVKSDTKSINDVLSLINKK